MSGHPKGRRRARYEPEMGDAVVDGMAQGLSILAVAGILRVGRSTIYEWIDRHPEFAEAVELGQSLRCLFWEQKLRGAASGPEVTSCIFTLKNAAPEEWRDRVDVGGKVTITIEGADAGFL